METALLVLSAAAAIGWGVFLLDLVLGQRYIRYLAEEPVPQPEVLQQFPALSVVVAARNEEQGIRDALQSLLRVEYTTLEIVAVDDRSEDATGTILDELAQADARLHVEHVDHLPEGWLGKNHALWLGASRARGELLLFTDADVIFDPTVLMRAVQRMRQDRLDHLTGPPDIRTPSLALELFVATFALFFNGFFRPWRMAAPGNRNGVGFWAFNLVRTDAYERAGTHRALALRADDDLRLGQLLGQSGARQAFAVLHPLVEVEWYASLGEAVRGLEKNSLAAVDFSLGLLMAGVCGQLLFTVGPCVLVVATSGVTRLFSLLAVALALVAQLYLLRSTPLRAWTALALPLGTVMVAFTHVRAACLTYARGGIRWRGTFYSLDTLKGSSERN